MELLAIFPGKTIMVVIIRVFTTTGFLIVFVFLKNGYHQGCTWLCSDERGQGIQTMLGVDLGALLMLCVPGPSYIALFSLIRYSNIFHLDLKFVQ